MFPEFLRTHLPATRFGAQAFGEACEIMFDHPLDRRKPDGARCHQCLFLSLAGYDKLLALATEG